MFGGGNDESKVVFTQLTQPHGCFLCKARWDAGKVINKFRCSDCGCLKSIHPMENYELWLHRLNNASQAAAGSVHRERADQILHILERYQYWQRIGDQFNSVPMEAVEEDCVMLGSWLAPLAKLEPAKEESSPEDVGMAQAVASDHPEEGLVGDPDPEDVADWGQTPPLWPQDDPFDMSALLIGELEDSPVVEAERGERGR